MKIFFITFFLIFFAFSHSSFSKINDKRVYNNLYKSCVKNPAPQFTSNETSKYCKCFSDDVVKYFTVRELIDLEMEINSVKDNETRLRISLSNKKFKDIASKCLAKIYN